MNATLQLRLSDNLFLKDPQSTELGRNIIHHSICMIDELGFESFTFKKLSVAINSTEASIYRYFENKHRLLVYLITWYWSWIEYRISVETLHQQDAQIKLNIALKIITQKNFADHQFPDIDEEALQRIVIAESDKTYLKKEIDQYNQEGLFLGYKSLCKLISKIILEINPHYLYPLNLASTILEASNQQIFFAYHLPSLTNLKANNEIFESNFHFLRDMVLKTINAS